MKQRTVLSKMLMVLVLALMLQGFGTTAWAASKNKAAKINASFTKNEERGYPFHALSMDLKKTGKLSKKNTFSGKFLIQKKLLKGTNYAFIIYPEVDCFLKNGTLAESLNAKYMIAVMRKKKGYGAYILTETTYKKAGKRASVKETSKGIVVEIKDLPLVPEDSGVATDKAYVICPTVWFLAEGADPSSGSIWTDSISIRTNKRQTITFDKKDYVYLHAYTEDGMPLPVSIKAAGK